MPLKSPVGPCCWTAFSSTLCTGWLLPHWMVVLARSRGMVALAAQAPLKPPRMRCSQVCSFGRPLRPSTALLSLQKTTSICAVIRSWCMVAGTVPALLPPLYSLRERDNESTSCFTCSQPLEKPTDLLHWSHPACYTATHASFMYSILHKKDFEMPCL